MEKIKAGRGTKKGKLYCPRCQQEFPAAEKHERDLFLRNSCPHCQNYLSIEVGTAFLALKEILEEAK